MTKGNFLMGLRHVEACRHLRSAQTPFLGFAEKKKKEKKIEFNVFDFL